MNAFSFVLILITIILAAAIIIVYIVSKDRRTVRSLSYLSKCDVDVIKAMPDVLKVFAKTDNLVFVKFLDSINSIANELNKKTINEDQNKLNS